MALTPKQKEILARSQAQEEKRPDSAEDFPPWPYKKDTHAFAISPADGEAADYVRGLNLAARQERDPDTNEWILLALLNKEQYQRAWHIGEDTGGFVVPYKVPQEPSKLVDSKPVPGLIEVYAPKLNKQDHIEDYEEQLPTFEFDRINVQVEETKELSREDYRKFTHDLLGYDYPWLHEKGGTNFPTMPEGTDFMKWWGKLSEKDQDRARKEAYNTVIKVVNKDRPEDFIYVDPQGYKYARYVYLPMNEKYNAMVHKHKIAEERRLAGTSPPAPAGKGIFRVNGKGDPVIEIWESFNGDLYFITEYGQDKDEIFVYARLYSMPEGAEWGWNRIGYLREEYSEASRKHGQGRVGIWKVPKDSWMNVNTYEKGILVED